MSQAQRKLCVWMAFAAALAGCSPAPTPTPAAPVQPEEGAEAGYLAPPQLVAAERRNAGVRLSGRAPPGALVRLASPDGQAFTAVAETDGDWRLDLPPAPLPRMFAFSAETQGHVLRAEGAVIAPPAPAYPALLARSGAAALPVGDGAGAPGIVSLDYDRGGGASVGGFAAPGAVLRLTVDGAQAGQGQADPRGRFAVAVTSGPLRPGAHAFVVQTPMGTAAVRVVLAPPAALTDALRVARVDTGWRLDWATPGGGSQTTYLLEPRGPAS